MSLIETSADPRDRAWDKSQHYNETCIEQERAGRRIRDFIILIGDGETRQEKHSGTNASLLAYLEDDLHVDLALTPWAAGYFDSESDEWVVNDLSTSDGLRDQIATRPQPGS